MDETLTPLSDGDAGTHVARPTDHEVGRVELVQLYVGIVRERGDRSRSREIVHDDGTCARTPDVLALGQAEGLDVDHDRRLEPRRPEGVPSEPPTHASLVAEGPDSPHRKVVTSPVAIAEREAAAQREEVTTR